MKCPNCDFESPPEMRFCGMCGTSLTRTCPACQYVNPVNYRFCGMCGEPLVADESSRAGSMLRAPAPTTTPVLRQVPTQDIPAQVPALEPPGAILEGERRVATILFADVVGSTVLLEKLGTESWVETMNNLFQAIESEVFRYNGEVGQFRGDGLVAFFGAKAANEDDPLHAVMAGLAIQQAVEPIAADMERRAGIQLSMRVGINTGEIIVANVGDAQYSEATAMGEALAVASRMESAAESGTVLVSESTWRLTRDEFSWTPLGEINVKGISHPMTVYRPLKALLGREVPSESGQETAIYGLSHGLIGRKNEFQALKKRIEELTAGRGSIILVTGVKGMGKSFLVNQVRQHFIRQNVLLAAAQQNKEVSGENSGSVEGIEESRLIRWLRGRCRSYGHLRPYSMWLDLMQEWLEAHPEDQAGDMQNLLRTQIETQWGNEVEKDYPNLATFLTAPSQETTTERAKHLDAEGLKRQFFQTVWNWVTHLAEQGPMVISFADMQWADTTSLELLEYCLPLSDSYPIVWMLVYRPDRESPVWDFQHRVQTQYPHRLTQLNIPPLSDEEDEEFIDQFLGKDVLIPETRQLIIKKAEGNPYFIKELIYSLISQGALVSDPEHNTWTQIRPVTSLDLPDSLQSLLMGRIDRLSQGERRVLQMAAVIGSVFWLNAIQTLAGTALSTRQIQADLVGLQRAGMIHERANIDDLGMEYAFDSSLIREVAYESLLNTQRVAYHLRVAEYLEDIVFREGKRRYFNILAHHYRLAGDVKKELFYTLQAAERAQSIYANVEAERYYTRALELLQQMESQRPRNSHQRHAILTQKFEALNGRRAVYFIMGNIEAGRADARALLPLARQMEQDPTWLIDALLQQPGVTRSESREELAVGVPMALEALNLAQKIGDKRREMTCLLTISSQRNLLNDPSWVEIGDRALQLSREIGDKQYEAMILLGLGHAYVGRDELQKGIEYLNAALPIIKSLNDKVADIVLLRVMGAQYERDGDHYRRLVEFEQKRLAIAREVGNRLEEGDSLMFCGQIQALNLGDLAGGLTLMREANQILEPVNGRIFAQLRIAQVQIALGQLEDAQQTMEMAAPVAEQNVSELGRVGYKIISLLLNNALGDEVHLKRVLELSDEIITMESNQLISRQYLMAAACEATAAHLGLSGLASNAPNREEHIQKALERSQVAVDTYARFGYVNIIECSSEEIFWRHSQALAANGMQMEAMDYLEKAYAEMMRKYDLIPADSHYRQSFLENFAIHRAIRAAHVASTLAKSNNSAKNH